MKKISEKETKEGGNGGWAGGREATYVIRDGYSHPHIPSLKEIAMFG